MAQLRILLIEDDVNDADLLAYALKHRGIDCTLQRVTHAIDLRAALAESTPMVIVCDFSLPHFDGFEALAISSQLRPDIPFFFCSGSIGDDRAQLALQLGAAGYAEKGKLATLIEQLTPYLDR